MTVTLKSSARVHSLSFRTKHAYGCVYLSGDHGTTILRKKQKKITAKYKCTGQVENYMDLAGKRVGEKINLYFINDERLRKKNHAAKTPKVKKNCSRVLETGQQTSKEALDSAASASIFPHPWVFDMFF